MLFSSNLFLWLNATLLEDDICSEAVPKTMVHTVPLLSSLYGILRNMEHVGTYSLHS